MRCGKSGLYLKNLRTRNLRGFKVFILVSCITRNLSVHAWFSFKSIIKNGFIGVKAFVEKRAMREGWATSAGDTIVILFTTENPPSGQYIRCGEGLNLLDWPDLFAPKLGGSANSSTKTVK
jgi:hypothetical protein